MDIATLVLLAGMALSIVALVAAAVRARRAPLPVRVHNVTRDVVVAEHLAVARTYGARLRGLMLRPSLPAGHGLWMPGTDGIHMLLMRFRIDALFLSRPGPDGLCHVAGLREGLRPWTGLVLHVRGAAGVLELPAGTLRATGTVKGDTIRLERAPR